ncbi:MAG: radical SAM family heme chaperone HemW [Alphaproteobacteria bacterium]|nr:radical SAM family heme chaperone HemW [Alphaproteobacteria bacterium]
MSALLALYVHWPFCRARCPYCDFNVHVRPTVDHARWRDALCAAIDHYARELPDRALGTIFFGGGTPSLMATDTVAAIVEHARKVWLGGDEIEVSLEANPSDIAHFADFAGAGVTRLSLGIQALDDASLKTLGRDHGRAGAIAAIEAAHAHFGNVSFDLIYARPKQSETAWRRELADALALARDHLSLYQLTIEPHTGFATALRQGLLDLPEDAAPLYEAARELCEATGFAHYEISNFARPGFESRHNLVYWRYGDYIGIGPGAHGRYRVGDTRVATVEQRAPERWLAAVEADGHAVVEHTSLSADERLTESLLMGLRLAEGVTRERFRTETGGDFESKLSAANLSELIGANLLLLDGKGLRATEDGRQRLDAVLARLLG